MFEGHQNSAQNSLRHGDLHSRIVLLNTSFVDNFAKHLGSAILSTNVEDVSMSCRYDRDRQKGFLFQSNLTLLAHIDPEHLCTSWEGNRIATSDTNGVVGTFGKRLSLSMGSSNSSSGVQLVEEEKFGFRLENTRIGQPFPILKIIVKDAFGNGPTPTIPTSFSVIVRSPDRFSRKADASTITRGIGTITFGGGLMPLGDYTLKITSLNCTLIGISLSIHVLGCHIGQELTQGKDLCQDCDASSYNFDVNKPRGCTPCPVGSTCKGPYIVPQDGYWHKGPCHNEVKECITEEACKYETRYKDLVIFTNNSIDCNMNSTALDLYNSKQCNKVCAFMIMIFASFKRFLR